jgi:hypothetical protein
VDETCGGFLSFSKTSPIPKLSAMKPHTSALRLSASQPNRDDEGCLDPMTLDRTEELKDICFGRIQGFFPDDPRCINQQGDIALHQIKAESLIESLS